MRPTMTSRTLLAAALLIVIAACGKKGKDDKPAAGSAPPATADAATAVAPAAVDAAAAAAPTGPAVTLASGETPLGCIAWSARDHAAACVTGTMTNGEPDLQLAFVGGGPGGQPVGATLDDAGAAALNKLLADGGYAAPGAATPVAVGAPLTVGAVTLTLTDKVTPSAGDNQAPTHAYALAARCGTTDHPLAADTAEGVTPSARAWQLGDRVLVELTLKLAREGEYGTTLGAAVIDGATCTVASALD